MTLLADIPAGRRYGCILADPPWQFANYSAAGEGRNPKAHYDTMPTDAICDLAVGELAADDCALFLWVCDPLVEDALAVVKAWGFRLSTVGFYWVKTNPRATVADDADPSWMGPGDDFVGLGYWGRANPEQCWLCTRGAPARLARDVRKLIIAPRREHSRKPDEAYERIERLVGGPRLELFARATRPGWDALGNQVGALDDGGTIARRIPSCLVKRQATLI